MPGTPLGKYTLIRKLAAGGMAEVFLASTAPDSGMPRSVVIKRILPHLAEDQGFVEMFLNEARVASQLNHPNVVSIFDLGKAGDSFYIAMELIDGPNLRTLSRRAVDAGRPLDPCLAAKMVSLAAAGLQYAHDANGIDGKPLNLIHRDISPDNILVSRQGMVKVVDFGIAKAANQGAQTKTGVLKGKLAYMAPEQIRGEGVDRRADVFALGVVLYELLAGTKPFDATSEVSTMQAILNDPPEPLLNVRPDAGEELAEIVDGCLQKDRTRRYPDCATLKADLDDFMVGQMRNITPDDLANLVEGLMGPAVPIEQTPPTKSRPGTGSGSGSRARPRSESSDSARPASSPGTRAIPRPPSGAGQRASRPGATAEGNRPSLEVLGSGADPRSAMGPATLDGPLANGDGQLMEQLLEDEPTHIGGPNDLKPMGPGPRKPSGKHAAESSPGRARAGAGSWAVPILVVVLLAGGIGLAVAFHTGALGGSTPSETTEASKEPGSTRPPIAPPANPTAVARAEEPPAVVGTPVVALPTSPTPTATTPPTPQEATPQTPTRSETRLGSRHKTEARDDSARHNKREAPEVASSSMAVPQTQPAIKTGTLRIHVLPWATISIDGRAYGTTPLAPVTLDSGHHSVVLDNADLKVHKELDVDVPSGGEQVVKLRLDQ